MIAYHGGDKNELLVFIHDFTVFAALGWVVLCWAGLCLGLALTRVCVCVHVDM